MERNYYTNDFEQLLKENADQFKMSPSKKVWHGIYNDIHPGRRWPSIAISLLFLFTLVLVGHLNTEQYVQNSLHGTQKNAHQLNADENESQQLAASKKPLRKYSRKISRLTAGSFQNPQVKIEAQLKEQSKEDGITTRASNPVNILHPTLENNSIGTTLSTASIEKDQQLGNIKMTGQNKDYFDLPGGIISAENALLKDNASSKVTPYKPITVLPAGTAPNLLNNETSKKLNGDKYPDVNKLEDKKAGATVAIIKPRKKSKVSWAYYLTPSVSYRKYTGQNNNADQMYLRYLNTSVSTDLNRAVTHRAALGMETGLALKYPLSKKLKFTAAFQLNYSSYTVQANNVHPIIATLVLHNEQTRAPYAVSSISYFGNGPGLIPEYLKNYSLNVGIPVGLEYQLAGNNDVQLSAAASFQPSLIIANSAYILSTDRRNYITEPSLSRRVNMNTTIGTMVSFKSNKFKWQVGPQVRYQLLSSFTNKYQTKEHFIDYGIRLGISK